MILHLLYSPRAEGCPRLALELLAQEKSQLGSKGEVAFCEESPGDLLPSFRERAGACHFLRWRRRGYLAFFRAFRRLLRARRPTAIICYTVGLHVPAAMAAWLMRIPIVLHLGNTPPVDRLALWKLRIQMFAGRPFVTAYAACSTIVAASALSEYGLPRGKVWVIPNGVDLSRYVALRASRAAPVRDRPLLLGMVGSLEAHKNHALLLQAFAQLRAQGPDSLLVLIGDGTLRSKLQDDAKRLGIEPYVRWAGSVTDVPGELAKLDVFAFCTTPSEGMGIAVVEALAAGLPVVASDVKGVREVLGGGEWGVLVSGEQPGDWAAALRRHEQARVPPPEALRRFDIAETFRMYSRLLAGKTL